MNWDSEEWMAEDVEEHPEMYEALADGGDEVKLTDRVKALLETWQEFDEAEKAGMSKKELREEFEEELGWFDCAECDWHGAAAPMVDDWSLGRIVECPECGGDVE